MNPHQGKTVALIDCKWDGHHPMYFSQFTASFLRDGARVIGLCPDPDAAFAALTQSVDEQTISRLGDIVHFAKIPVGKRSFFNGRYEGDPVRTFQRWRDAGKTLANSEAVTGWQTDLVFFPYLDSYMRFLPFPVVPEITLHRPWSGLYLRNHHHAEKPSLLKSLRIFAKGDAILKNTQCKSVGVLDERHIQALEKLSGKIITAYPDVTQGGLPAQPIPLVLEIQRKAAGRKIIGIIGLEHRKGFLTFIRAAKLAQQQNLPYYFVAAGAIHHSDYTITEWAEISAASKGIESGQIDNLHFHAASGRIPNERDYNSLFTSFDIAWAAYEGFQGSSGTLSKAALFEIPCIATVGECIGQRVEKYRIGITIPEAATEKIIAAIPFLIAKTDSNHQSLNPDFAGYRNDHSQARLDQILSKLLASV
ncbi:MAG: glycosyltransferase [Gloeobacteraceae cyanobacterium ES-bin-144]|nr:glycosyltransferase [Verrucomicrobiales bacterium]